MVSTWATVLPKNIRLRWKQLTLKNDLAYHKLNYAIKKFYGTALCNLPFDCHFGTRALLANVIKYCQVFTKDKHSTLFAWSNFDEEKHFTTFSTEYSSIQGVIYISQANQSPCGRLFWILVVTLMLMLGLYWSADAYTSWQDNPILTTVTTTAYPITKVTPYKCSSLSRSRCSSMVR
jgi:Amiloride-sensitive sodium channel